MSIHRSSLGPWFHISAQAKYTHLKKKLQYSSLMYITDIYANYVLKHSMTCS